MSAGTSGAMAEPSGEVGRLELPGDRIVDVLGTPEAQQLEQDTLPEFLPRQRWFGAKDSTIKGVALLPLGELEPGKHALVAADVALATETQRYLLPLSAFWEK